MPTEGKAHLRIYCVCGQKMKFSEELFGRPGKCVACRQKIRVPRRDELPEGSNEIYLKDHPEFLRNVAHPPAELSPREIVPISRRSDAPKMQVKDAASAEIDVVARKRVEVPSEDKEGSARPKGPIKKRERSISLPLDVLEPLSELCSLRIKIESQIAAMGDGTEGSVSAVAEAEGHLTRIRQAHADLNEKMRQTLMETAIELASTQEKIAQTQLSARVGEIDLDSYRDATYKLRERRDRLERRQENLRGWLATDDPHIAGAYVDLSISSLPDDDHAFSFPSEPEDGDAPVNRHSAALRDAFHRRAEAEQKRGELDRMERSGTSTAKDLAIARADTRGELKRAQARIGFCRIRMEQLGKDFSNDLETFKAQLELARGRLQVNEMQRAEFDALEKRLRRARTDAAKAKSFVERTLAANSAHDVPRPKGTFLERLTVRTADAAGPAERWAAWVAAALFTVGAFLPAVGNVSLVAAFLEFRGVDVTQKWIFLAPIILGAALIMVVRLLNRGARAWILTALWAAATVLSVYLIHEAQFGLDPMSARFRSSTIWIARPGMLVFVLGNLALLFAIGLTYAPLDRQRIALFVAIPATIIVSGLILTNVGGYYLPRPQISIALEPLGASSSSLARHRGTITVHNEGHRALYLVSYPSGAKGAYVFLLQQKIGANSWSQVGPSDLLASSDVQHHAIGPGASSSVPVSLADGDYRLLLVSNATREEIEEPFRVGSVSAALADEGNRTEISGGEDESADREPEPEPETISEETTDLSSPDSPAITPDVTVELRGLMQSREGEPMFSVVLRYPDGSSQSTTIGLREKLVGEWEFVEFDSLQLTATLSNESRKVTLLTGEPQELSFEAE